MTKKFDPLAWSECDPKKDYDVPAGRLCLKLSAPAPIYLTVEGVESLVTVASDCDIRVHGEATFSVDAPKGVRIFLEMPSNNTREPEGVVFTNMDMVPVESDALLELRRELRRDALERRAERDQLVHARVSLERALEEAKLYDRKPVEIVPASDTPLPGEAPAPTEPVNT